MYFSGAGAAAAGLLAITPGSSHMVRQVFGQVSDNCVPFNSIAVFLLLLYRCRVDLLWLTGLLFKICCEYKTQAEFTVNDWAAWSTNLTNSLNACDLEALKN
jgi:hypothetical protein